MVKRQANKDMVESFEIRESGEKVFIGIRDGSYLDAADLGEPLLDAVGKKIEFAGREIILEGKGPMWFYAHLAYRAICEGARAVQVVQQPSGEEIEVYRETGEAGGIERRRPDWITLGGNENVALRFTVLGDQNIPSSDLKWARIDWPEKIDSVCVSGRGANWMYGFVGAEAARKKIDRVACDLPHAPAILAVGTDRPGTYLLRPTATKSPGLVLGVLGDPNSGKSVFSKWLSSLCGRAISNCWSYDCDHASPTPDWYVAGVRAGQLEKVKPVRERQKRKWKPELEARVAKDLANLKKNLDFVVADLPGGDHKGGRCDRMPPGREVIMQGVDAFIILGREGEPEIIDGWRAELRKHGLENRIVAEIVSGDPSKDLTVTLHRDGSKIRGTAEGLDRTKDLTKALSGVDPDENLLLRYVRAWQAAEVAREATAQSFLTKPGGNCYGAAVLTRQGNLFRSGQYSSFNHSTNIHAEMGALLQATMAGEPDVLVLALAKSKGDEVARPCGVCRQVMIEHAQRTGRDFDVAMLDRESERYEICRVSELLPLAWSKATPRVAGSQRKESAPPETMDEAHGLRCGEQVLWAHGGRNYLGLIWDPHFEAPGVKALIKLKYEEVAPGLWDKLPHSFSQAAEYEKFLSGKIAPAQLRFGGAAVVVERKEFRSGYPLQPREDLLPKAFGDALAEAGLGMNSVQFTGSTASGFTTESSDLDLICRASPGQIARLREILGREIERGVLGVPDGSQSWKILASVFPGGEAAMIRERRFAETFVCDSRQIVIIFDRIELAPALLMPAMDQVKRMTCTGVVTEADHCAYKRAEFVVRARSGRFQRVISYLKTANLLRRGDRIAVAGWPARPAVGDGGEALLVQVSAATDSLVWLAKAGGKEAP